MVATMVPQRQRSSFSTNDAAANGKEEEDTAAAAADRILLQKKLAKCEKMIVAASTVAAKAKLEKKRVEYQKKLGLTTTSTTTTASAAGDDDNNNNNDSTTTRKILKSPTSVASTRKFDVLSPAAKSSSSSDLPPCLVDSSGSESSSELAASSSPQEEPSEKTNTNYNNRPRRRNSFTNNLGQKVSSTKPRRTKSTFSSSPPSVLASFSKKPTEAEEAEEDLGTAAAPMIASLESGNKQLIVEGGDNNNNNNAHANSIRQETFGPSTIWNETQWRTCFDFSWQQSSQKQSFANTMLYSTKALHDLVTVSHVPMFVLATAMRPPKLSSEVCSLPFITMVTADHNYTVDGNVYDRDTQNCWDPNVQERPFNMLCQRYDFAWQLDFAKTHAESVGSEWILLFEDDVSFCPGLFEYVKRMMQHEDTNIVFLSRGQLGMLVRVSFIERYIQLIYPDADEKNPKPVDAKLTYAGKEEGVLWTKINMVFHPRKSPSTLDHIYDSDRSCYELGTHRKGNKYIPFVDPVTMAVGYLDKKGNSVNIKVPYPIFVPSLPTPGSKTVHGYFQCGNQAAAHGTVQVPSPSGELKKMYAGKCIRRNIQEHRQAFENCGDYDIYVDTTVLTKPSMHSKKVKDCFFPPLDALEEIYASYPNATWLLLTRNSKSWVYSARRDMDTTWRNCPSFDGLLPNPASKATTQYQDYEQFYNQHNDRVRQFVADHPSLTFLEVSLEGNNTAQILEQEVGISSKCWRH